MSRVTAAFVCALCDPDDPRAASIMCSNNCGRYVCSVHAMPRKGPGSAMVCLACAEALGLLETPRPKHEAAPIVAIPAEPVVVMPKPQPDTTFVAKAEPIVEPPAPAIEPAIVTPPIVAKADETVVNQPAPAQPKFDAESTLIGAAASITSPTPKETFASTATDNVVPADAQSQAARRLVEPPPPPQSSETIVSQRGNTLQVPKVTQTFAKPPQPIAAKLRSAQRTKTASGPNQQVILLAVGSVVLGIVGFLMILKALFP